MVRNEKKEMTAGEIADKICEIAPEALQETWDNSWISGWIPEAPGHKGADLS